MTPGDRVQRPRDGAIGVVREVHDEGRLLVVEVDGELREWTRTTVVAVQVTHAPRGVTKASGRQLEAARMIAEGRRKADVAAHFGVQPHTIDRWMQDVRAAVQDARQLAALSGSRR